jgi:hypothetical protein
MARYVNPLQTDRTKEGRSSYFCEAFARPRWQSAELVGELENARST